MSIYDDLERMEINEHETMHYGYMLQDFNSLCMSLSNCEEPDQVTKILKMELQGQNRPSYVSRIYGRYRRLLPNRDRGLMQDWRRDYARKNN